MKVGSVLGVGVVAIIFLIILTNVMNFGFDTLDKAVNGTKTETLVQDTREVGNFEIERIKERYFFGDVNTDYVRLYFSDGSVEVNDNPWSIHLKKGKENKYYIKEKRHIKTENTFKKEKVLELNEEVYREFTKEYARTYNEAPNELK